MTMPFDRSGLEPFRCELESRRDAVHVRPIGELDLAAVPVVEAQLAELTAAGFAHLVLDLREVSFLDSSGLHLILTWDARARDDGLAFELIPGPAPVQRMFDVTGVAERLSFAGAACAQPAA
jgi:anti-sigma B factor antagonist